MLPFWTKWIVPPVVLAPAFLVTFVDKALRYTVATGSGYTVVKVGEWPEACIAFALAAFAFTVWRGRRRSE